MNRHPVFLSAILGLGIAALIPSAAMAQRDSGLTAREALDLIASRFGEDQIEWIVEMRGFEGVPEPEEWEIALWDPRTRSMVREFWAGGREVSNEGSSDDYYPERSPFGFVRLSDLKLDSKAAFVIAEAEARKARMGFDALNYFLRCREFSREPVWTLELLDAGGDMAGKVYISGETGEVLRTVWIYRGERGRPDGGALIVDSAAPREDGSGASSGARGGATPPMTTTDTSGPGETLRRFESADEPDPLAPTVPPSAPPRPPAPPVPPSSDPDDTRIPPPPLPPAP